MDIKLDVSASYPTGECAFNMSRRTTVRELCTIFGIDEEEFRMQNMGLSAGHVNSLEYSMSLMKFPELPSLLDMFEQDIAAGKVEMSKGMEMRDLTPALIHIE